MESTETIENKPLTVEEAVSGLISPELTGEATETVEEETQTTEEETIEASDENEEVEELTAESDTEEVEASDETDEEVEEIEASAEDEIDNDYEENAVQESDSDLISVKVNGQIKNVTLDELKQGYSGQEYVQQGMQENAQMKKEVEGVYQALMNERQQVTQLLQQMQQGDIASKPTAPSKELFDNDPLGYMEAKMKYDDALSKYNEQMQKIQQVTDQQSQAEQRAKQEYLKQEMQQLQKVIPEFADAKKATQVKDKLIQSGQNYYGYTAEEIGLVADHRAIRVLHDAIKYREIMAGKDKAVKNTKKKVVKAGAKKVSDGQSKVRQKQMAKLKQTGSIQDAVSLIMNS
jgi:hypothetical protein